MPAGDVTLVKDGVGKGFFDAPERGDPARFGLPAGHPVVVFLGVLPPDPGSIRVNWVKANGDGTYRTSFQWSHDITTAEDPSLNYTAFTAQWILEGTMTVDDEGIPRISVDLDIPSQMPPD